MGRVSYLAFIAAVFAVGVYFAFVDFKFLETDGSLPAIGIYEALACLVSAVALLMDYRQPSEENNAIA